MAKKSNRPVSQQAKNIHQPKTTAQEGAIKAEQIIGKAVKETAPPEAQGTITDPGLDGGTRPVTEKGVEGSPGYVTQVDVNVDSIVGVASYPDGSLLTVNEGAVSVRNEGQTDGMQSFDEAVDEWLIECFGETIARDKVERNHRFLEEALELVQSAGCSRQEAHKLVDYVFGRPRGELRQEVGGTYVTLLALCAAHDIDLLEAGSEELQRIQGRIEQIREKQRNKPRFSALPQ